jgi:RNA polymerase primary sigma factor
MKETMRDTLEEKQPTNEARPHRMPDILTIYFREIARFPILDREEERKLARAMAAGVDGARERLITSNLRLVAKIAQEYSEAGLSLIDLVQEGNIGLIEGVDRFDVERGRRLSTYAAWWIRRAILSAITDYSRMIRIPDYLFRAVRRLEQLRALARDGRADDEEITRALGISSERLRQIEKEVKEIVSLDRTIGREGDETLDELIEDETVLSPEREALRLLFHEELEQVLDVIPARQAIALRLHYGIEDGCQYSLADVGRIMEISRERARQLVRQGLTNITEGWGHRALDFYRGLLND